MARETDGIVRPYKPRTTPVPRHRCMDGNNLVHWLWSNSDSTLCGRSRDTLTRYWPSVYNTVNCLGCWARLLEPPF